MKNYLKILSLVFTDEDITSVNFWYIKTDLISYITPLSVTEPTVCNLLRESLNDINMLGNNIVNNQFVDPDFYMISIDGVNNIVLSERKDVKELVGEI